MKINWLWDTRLTEARVAKILQDESDPRFYIYAEKLFSRVSDPNIAFKYMPKDKLGKSYGLKDWTLNNYIDVAHELGWVSQPVKDISVVLRDYRNFIHPHKEYTMKLNLHPDDAAMLWDVCKSIARQILTIK